MTVAIYIIVAAFCGFILGLAVRSQEPRTRWHEDDAYECPAMIRGYNCKGDLCDHSRLAVLKARVEMEESRIAQQQGDNLLKGPKL